MKKNLILGILDNYTFHQVKKFVYSLRETSFDGDLVLFIGPYTTARTKRKLKEFGVIMHFFPALGKLPDDNLTRGQFKLRNPINYFNFRHYLYYDFLQRNRDKYENVLLTDVRDVYFQRDPFDFPIDDRLFCALEGAGATIAQCRFNGPWMKYIYGQEVLDRIGSNFISCAGTSWGKTATILDYLEKMLREIEKVPDAKIAIDQAIHNYMIYTGMLKNTVFLKNDSGIILTCSYEKNYTIRDNKVWVDGDKLVAALHQFNRYPDLESLTDRIYLKAPVVNYIHHKLHRTELVVHKTLHKLKTKASD